MFKSENNLKTKFRFSRKSGAGFTITEMLVVVLLIALLVTILVSNFPKTNQQFSLSRAAYKFAQDVRRTQGMALSAQYKNANGDVLPVKGYGVYVKLADNKKYIIYASPGSYATQQFAGDSRYSPTFYTVETIDFSVTNPGVVIKEINGDIFQPLGTNDMSIYFYPPLPTVALTSSNNSENTVDIVFALQGDLTVTKTVSINLAGLVEVK